MEAIRSGKRLVRGELVKRAEVVTTLAGRAGELPLLSGNRTVMQRALRSFLGTPDVVFAAFDDAEGRPLSSAGRTPPPFSTAVSGRASIILEHPDSLECYAPIFTVRTSDELSVFGQDPAPEAAGEQIGWVRLGFSRASLIAGESRIVRRGLLLALLFTTGSCLVVALMVTISTRPLRALAKGARKISCGEYPEIAVVTGDEFGQLAGEFNGMSRAIQEREARIIASEQRIKDLFERVEHAIFRLDAAGAIVERNRKFEALCGHAVRLEELFVAPGGEERLRQALAGDLKNVELGVRGTGGREFQVVMSVYPERDAGGRLLGYDGYFMDLTEKRRLEEMLFQTQKLESLGLLAGGIAHDFNNILTGVLGYATMLKTMLPAEEKSFRFVDMIEKSALRASGLTRQLLGFARKGKYRTEIVDVNGIACDLVAFLKETLDRAIAVGFETASGALPVVGDANQLYQALLNLCVNARDAMAGGGRLFLKTETYRLQDEKVVDLFRIPAGTYARVSVTDTGTGMTAEVRKRIFEPFYTTKDQGKGTGLGLSMVYGIVSNHGGYINVYSEVGLGTTIQVYLPKAEGDAVVRDGAVPLAQRPRTGTILLVEDEEVIRQLARDILEAHNYRVLLRKRGWRLTSVQGPSRPFPDRPLGTAHVRS
ncbi:MAG TPA: ATP-binding protein [bacterium]